MVRHNIYLVYQYFQQIAFNLIDDSFVMICDAGEHAKAVPSTFRATNRFI